MSEYRRENPSVPCGGVRSASRIGGGVNANEDTTRRIQQQQQRRRREREGDSREEENTGLIPDRITTHLSAAQKELRCVRLTSRLWFGKYTKPLV